MYFVYIDIIHAYVKQTQMDQLFCIRACYPVLFKCCFYDIYYQDTRIYSHNGYKIFECVYLNKIAKLCICIINGPQINASVKSNKTNTTVIVSKEILLDMHHETISPLFKCFLLEWICMAPFIWVMLVNALVMPRQMKMSEISHGVKPFVHGFLATWF